MQHIANEVDVYQGDGRQMNTFADFSPLPVLCSWHKRVCRALCIRKASSCLE